MNKGTWLALGIMIGVAIAAFGIPVFWFDDQASPGVSDEALPRLKTQETVGYKIHPLFYQVRQAHMTGPTPDHVEGSVVWRTLFGVSVGHRYDINVERWIAVWGAFLSIELGLGFLVLRRLRRSGDL